MIINNLKFAFFLQSIFIVFIFVKILMCSYGMLKKWYLLPCLGLLGCNLFPVPDVVDTNSTADTALLLLPVVPRTTHELVQNQYPIFKDFPNPIDSAYHNYWLHGQKNGENIHLQLSITNKADSVKGYYVLDKDKDDLIPLVGTAFRSEAGWEFEIKELEDKKVIGYWTIGSCYNKSCAIQGSWREQNYSFQMLPILLDTVPVFIPL